MPGWQPDRATGQGGNQTTGEVMGRRRETNSDGNNPYSIRAVERVCDLLDLLQEAPDGVSLIRAADVTSLPKSSAYLDLVESPRTVRVAARRGDRYPLHSNAVGKAIAATLPEHRVRAILKAEGMPRLTRHTMTDLDSYLGELGRVRALGYAVDDGEHEDDERSLATPLPSSNLPAALSVSAPASRLPLDSIRGLAKPLVETAAQLVGDLGGHA